MARILIVEDDKTLRDAFSILLEMHGYTVTIATNGQEAVELCKTNHYNLILLDLMMPFLDGIGFLKASNIRSTAPDTRIIVLSNLSSEETLHEAESLGAHRQAIKSALSPKDILEIVQEEIEK